MIDSFSEKESVNFDHHKPFTDVHRIDHIVTTHQPGQHPGHAQEDGEKMNAQVEAIEGGVHSYLKFIRKGMALGLNLLPYLHPDADMVMLKAFQKEIKDTADREAQRQLRKDHHLKLHEGIVIKKKTDLQQSEAFSEINKTDFSSNDDADYMGSLAFYQSSIVGYHIHKA